MSTRNNYNNSLMDNSFPKNISTTNNAMWIWMAKYGDFAPQKRGFELPESWESNQTSWEHWTEKWPSDHSTKATGRNDQPFSQFMESWVLSKGHILNSDPNFENYLNDWYLLEVENDTQHSPLQEASCFLYTNWEKVPIFSVVYMYTYMMIYVYMQSYFT